MKYLFYFALASVIFNSSCSKNDDQLETKDFSLNEYPQTWKLIKMTGGMEGSVSVGEEMAWQEHYVFNSDSSFVKTRVTEGESISASGSYVYDSSNQNFLLDYLHSSQVIGNCTSDEKEHLYFSEDSEILLSNWWACDGPGLFYERIK